MLMFEEVQHMIRKATFDDLGLIEDTYNEHFKYEIEHGAFNCCNCLYESG